MSVRHPHRGASRAAVAGVAVAALLASLLGAAASTGPAHAAESSLASGHAAQADTDDYATSAVLPFNLPSTSSLRASKKKVFANWVVSLPASFDNRSPADDYYTKQYLNPNGENGKHRAYGGYLRDRPLGRAPRAGDWRLEDLKNEVRQAISVGIDGFTMVIYTIPDNPASTGTPTWNTARLMMRAAAAVDPGFKIIPMPDMTTLTTITASKLAASMAYLATFSSIYRLSDGRALYSPFFAEKRTATWWSGWLTTMRTANATPTALWPTFLNEQDNRRAFGPIMVGTGNWGARFPDGNPTSTAYGLGKWRIGQVHSAGEQWMQPVSIQDDRPRRGTFVEAENTQNLRNTWDIAINGGADWVQLLTWNDLPESSGILPSLRHGWTFLDLMAYYITWFKTGSAPAITKDAIYLTHRTQWAADKPTFPQTILGKNIGATPTRDSIEALVFLKAPATVTIATQATSFRCSAPAGLSTCVAPLGSGTVSARVVRNGTQVSAVTSPYPVSHLPYVQDLQYVGVSSLREGSTATTPTPTPAPAPTPAPTPTSTRTSLSPIADTYANADAPTNSFGWSSQLLVRGGTLGSEAHLRFNLPAAPQGKRLTSATLRLRTTSSPNAGSSSPATISTHQSNWSETAMNWTNRPLGPFTVVGTLPGGTVPNTLYSTSLDTTAIAAAQDGRLNLAIRTTSADPLQLWSTGHDSKRVHPELVLTYG